MIDPTRIEQAWRSDDPGRALSDLVRQLAAEGHAKKEILSEFERFVLAIRERPDFIDSEQDILLDVMDALVGWCHPAYWLLPDQEPYPLGQAPAEPGSQQID